MGQAVELDPVPVMGTSTPRGKESARRGTGGSTSAMWMPALSVRSLDHPLETDFTHLKLVNRIITPCVQNKTALKAI